MIAYVAVETNGCCYTPVICGECQRDTGTRVPTRGSGLEVIGICHDCNQRQIEEYHREEALADLL